MQPNSFEFFFDFFIVKMLSVLGLITYLDNNMVL